MIIITRNARSPHRHVDLICATSSSLLRRARTVRLAHCINRTAPRISRLRRISLYNSARDLQIGWNVIVVSCVVICRRIVIGVVSQERRVVVKHGLCIVESWH
jgi:hypothetical protein